ncbi:hypothetical protein TcCL_Unassigned01198 [Trypanosoma cruzi]|nr:hypothetical protein TcCL_Unassigned01198 [Trypanosoma cruzi]
MSNIRVLCAVFHHNTLSSVGSGLYHTKGHRCNITYTQQSEIRKNIAIVIQDATTTIPLSSCCNHILQNMIHADRKFVVQLYNLLMGQVTRAKKRQHQSVLGRGIASESH